MINWGWWAMFIQKYRNNISKKKRRLKREQCQRNAVKILSFCGHGKGVGNEAIPKWHTLEVQLIQDTTPSNILSYVNPLPKPEMGSSCFIHFIDSELHIWGWVFALNL